MRKSATNLVGVSLFLSVKVILDNLERCIFFSL